MLEQRTRPSGRLRAVRERLGVEPHDLGGDHTPMLSQPDRLAEVLLAETSPSTPIARDPAGRTFQDS
jgi:hypothetical protein